MEARGAPGTLGRRPVNWRIAGMIAAIVIITLSVLWMAAESHYRSCIARANAKYPAVPVSAYNGRSTGPLRVSFVAQRQAAVDACHRY
jgi:hypothetical protein